MADSVFRLCDVVLDESIGRSIGAVFERSVIHASSAQA